MDLRSLCVAFAVLSVPALAAEGPADMRRASEIVAERCAMCHGSEGASASPIFPRLAGQHAEYVAKQLGDFKSGKRASEAMKPQADSLTEADMQALGAYFAAKKPAPRRAPDADLAGVGRYIFVKGNRYSGVPACASCHGERGHGTAQLPRLAGQHPRYIEEQLRQFNKRERSNDNAVMHTVASRLTELEAVAVAEYLATLD